MMRRNICAAVALASSGILAFGALPAMADDVPAYTLPSATPTYIRAAIDDPARTPEQRARDVNRKPELVIAFAGIKPGKYSFNCTPHLAMNMKGTVTVTP